MVSTTVDTRTSRHAAWRPSVVLLAASLSVPAMAAHDTPEPLRDITGSESWYTDFAFSPNLSVGYEYDDNIFATDSGEISDRVWRTNVAGRVSSTWDRHALQAGAGAAINRYDEYDSEDTEDYRANLSGRFDLTDTGNLFGGVSYAREHEARGSIESVAGDEPTLYHKRQANAGLNQAFGAFGVTLAGDIVAYDYENTPAGLGEIFNDDRDRNMSAAGVRVSYTATEQWTYFARLRSDIRDYDLELDDALYQRDSTGYRLGIGGKANFGETLQAELVLGFLSQDYDDPRFDTIDEFDYEGSLSWYLSKASHLRLALAHSLEETTLPGSPGYLYRQVSGLWSQRFSDVLFGKVSASYGQADYQQSTLVDDYYVTGLGISRVFTKGIMGSVDYRHIQRDSSFPTDDFSRNQYMLSVSARF